MTRRPMQGYPSKISSISHKSVHIIHECRTKQSTPKQTSTNLLSHIPIQIINGHLPI